MKISITIDENKSERFLEVVHSPREYFQVPFSIGLRRIGDEGAGKAGTLAPFKRGNLRRSILPSPQVGLPKDYVEIGTNLVYAQIHDEGGTITAKKGKYLRFQVNGQWVTVRSVRIPKYRGQGYFTPMVEEMIGGRAEEIMLEEFDRKISS